MKKTLISYLFASVFFICAVLITDIQAKITQEKRKISSVALATPNNEIIFFKKDPRSSLIIIKLCSSSENLQKTNDCKLAKNTYEVKVPAETLKNHLMTAFAMHKIPEEKMTQKLQKFWEMKTLGSEKYSLDSDARELEKIENILAEVCGEQNNETKCAKEYVDVQKLTELRKKLSSEKNNLQIIESINEVMGNIIDRLILSPEIHFISSNSPGFVYSILSSYIRPHEARFEFATIQPASIELKDLRYQGKNQPKSVRVKVTNAFEIGKTEVTQFQWFSVMGYNPSFFKRPTDCPDVFIEGLSNPLRSGVCADFPVENVSWKQIQTFLDKLNKQDSQFKYRLPSEAEWVLASSDGKNEMHFFGNDLNLLQNYAWYSSNSSSKTQAVAKKMVNSFGLFDVYGNVAEWVQDSFDELPANPPNNFIARENEGNQLLKVVRGGHFGLDASLVNSTMRFNNYSFE
ncbi:MAG: formylglycine-generating enzyme family protein, partial [Pseudobdellovibrionaceae bacterium]